MNRSLLALAILTTGTASATPFTGNDARSNAMGNTGVASAPAASAQQFNPALLSSYSGQVSFAMTIPSLKLYIDDSQGLVSSGRDFTEEGGTIDQFEQIDAEAFSVAVFGDTDTGTPSMEDVLGNIASDVTDLNNAINNIKNDTDNGNQPDDADVQALNTASASLTTNTGTLDQKVVVADTEANNLQGAVQTTKSDFQGLDDKAFNLGLGMDLLNVNLPREGLGMGLSITSNTTIGAKIFLNDNDFSEVDDMLADLTGLTGEASDLSGSMTTLAEANEALTNHINALPDPDDYPGGQTNEDYQDDVEAWGIQLDSLSTDLENAQTDVNAQQVELVEYEGEYYDQGEVNAPELEDFESEIEVVGANITEIGVTVAREFEYMGETFSAGVTPKIVSLNIFEKRFGVESADEEFGSPQDFLEENSTFAFTANIDVGAAKDWPDVLRGDVRAGVVIKDLIPQTFETQSGNELSIGPKMRIGAAHLTRWSTLSADLDITENDPLKYGVPTRYLGLGGEFNAWNWLKLRAGYRNNLSVSDSHVISTGFGITPFGVGLDLSGWFKPKSFDDWDEMIQDAGIVAQFSMEF